jgi:DnaK suppressor protein
MVMDANDLLRYKNLLLAKQKELSSERTRGSPVSTVGETGGDPVDVAASETIAATEMRLKESDSKLLRAIEDALTRIRQERFGICEECGEPISKVRLEAVPWARHCKDCKERRQP